MEVRGWPIEVRPWVWAIEMRGWGRARRALSIKVRGWGPDWPGLVDKSEGLGAGLAGLAGPGWPYGGSTIQSEHSQMNHLDCCMRGHLG